MKVHIRVIRVLKTLARVLPVAALAALLLCPSALAYDKAAIKSELLSRLYKSSGGYVSCDFDGYQSTPGKHEGIDCVIGAGHNVYAITGGEVVDSRVKSGLSTIAIYNSAYNVTIVYLHSNSQVSKGQTVEAGALIATESSMGASSVHTHVELRQGRCASAAKSVNDWTLENPDPYPYYETIFSIAPPPTPQCSCSTTYAGTYVCTVSAGSNLMIRSGHGKDYDIIGAIPSGAEVAVSKGDGNWMHVSYGGAEGYSSAQWLERKGDPIVIPTPDSERIFDYLVFNEAFYRAANTDVTGSSETVRAHWQNYGLNEGRQGSQVFCGEVYVGLYPNLKDAFGTNYRAALEHFLDHGISEGKQASAHFNLDRYKANYRDLQIAFGDDNESYYRHFIAHGWDEGRLAREYLTVRFDANGGSVSPAKKNITTEMPYGSLPMPTRSGYFFDGWYTQPTGGTRVYEDTIVPMDPMGEHRTVYAHWLPLVNMDISSALDGESPVDVGRFDVYIDGELLGENIYSFGGDSVYGETYEIDNIQPMDGYVYVGASGSLSGIVSSSDVNIALNFERAPLETSEVNIECRVDGVYKSGVGLFDVYLDGEYSSTCASYGGDMVVGTRYEIKNIRAMDGYVYEGASGPLSGSIPSGSLDIALVFRPNDHCVTLDANGGTVSPDYVMVRDETAIGTLPTPSRTYYTFDGWFTEPSGGSEVDGNTIVTESMTLYAHWTRIQYKVTIDAAGGTSPLGSIMVNAGSAIGYLPAPSRTHYTFDGWFTERTGGSAVNGNTVVTEPMTIYAHWTRLTYRVSFDAAGGTVSTSFKTVNAGDAVGTLPGAVRTGYVFKGWFTEPSGGSQVTAVYVPAGNVTLYAQWEKEPDPVTPMALPANTTTIEAEAFRATAFEAIIVPEGCQTLGSKAFADCPNLKQIALPTSIRGIADDIFSGCGEGLTIICDADSYVAWWAERKGYTVVSE